eukprot:970986-Rhodomonas_salina.4
MQGRAGVSEGMGLQGLISAAKKAMGSVSEERRSLDEQGALLKLAGAAARGAAREERREEGGGVRESSVAWAEREGAQRREEGGAGEGEGRPGQRESAVEGVGANSVRKRGERVRGAACELVSPGLSESASVLLLASIHKS